MRYYFIAKIHKNSTTIAIVNRYIHKEEILNVWLAIPFTFAQFFYCTCALLDTQQHISSFVLWTPLVSFASLFANFYLPIWQKPLRTAEASLRICVRQFYAPPKIVLPCIFSAKSLGPSLAPVNNYSFPCSAVDLSFQFYIFWPSQWTIQWRHQVATAMTILNFSSTTQQVF